MNVLLAPALVCAVGLLVAVPLGAVAMLFPERLPKRWSVAKVRRGSAWVAALGLAGLAASAWFPDAWFPLILVLVALSAAVLVPGLPIAGTWLVSRSDPSETPAHSAWRGALAAILIGAFVFVVVSNWDFFGFGRGHDSESAGWFLLLVVGPFFLIGGGLAAAVGCAVAAWRVRTVVWRIVLAGLGAGFLFGQVRCWAEWNTTSNEISKGSVGGPAPIRTDP